MATSCVGLMHDPGLACSEIGLGMIGLIGMTPMSQASALDLLSLGGSADSFSML